MKKGLWRSVLLSLMFCFVFNESWSEESPLIENRVLETGRTHAISPEESEIRLQDAALLFEEGKTDAAMYKLQQLEQADPTNHKLLIKLGEMAIKARNWAYAIQVLRKASFLRPKDIEIRLILLDIYKAYQAPIQEIIVGREILALNPNQVVILRRLADLYQEQALLEEEIAIRQELLKLEPTAYNNLKRLAMIFDEKGQLWESAKVYERIRSYYPSNIDDMRRLAAIYDRLGENFRELLVLDHIAKQGEDRGWMLSRAREGLRKQADIFDPFKAALELSLEKEWALEVRRIRSDVQYTRIIETNSFDLGVEAVFTRFIYDGVNLLDGRADINNSTVKLQAYQHWLAMDSTLAAYIGLTDDQVSGRLFLREPVDPAVIDDFPFLTDPSFDSYGGTSMIGGMQFTVRNGLHTEYIIDYQHDLIREFDARLRRFTYDKVTLSVDYETGDHTQLQLELGNILFSDGNYRFHGRASGYYVIWGHNPIYDYRGRRKGFFREPLSSYIKVGYELEYLDDHDFAEDSVYETFVSPETRYKAVLLGQTRLFKFDTNDQALFNLRWFYGEGTTQDYAKGVSARLFYYMPDSANEVGLTYSFSEELSNNFEMNNIGFGGYSKEHQFVLNIKWHFF